ncbi:hypothetical protein [Streptomyces sp. HNM0645]|uniref:hypothetical protein n=1 Tax=Streptomyces sp. HNM0645 TaxID=2782343 RepID=UPI0032D5B02A
MSYVEEIFGVLKDAGVAVHHFFLKVSEEVLVKRIDGRSFTPDDPEQDERVRGWCKSKIESCIAAVDTLPGDTVFLDGELSPREWGGRESRRYRADLLVPRTTMQPPRRSCDGGGL